jgi:hypothetical protein
MISILLVTGLYALTVWTLLRRWKKGLGSGQFVLAVLPICLLFIAARIPFSARAFMTEFSRIAEEGSGGFAVIGPTCLASARDLRLGTLACLIGLGAAATVQTFVTNGSNVTIGSQATGRAMWWRVVILAMSPVVMVPIVFLSQVMREIPTVVMRVKPFSGLTDEELGLMSEVVSRNVVMAFGFGILLIILLCAVSAATFIAARFGTSQRHLTVYSWAVVALVCSWGAWLVFQLTVDIRTIQFAMR